MCALVALLVAPGPVRATTTTTTIKKATTTTLSPAVIAKQAQQRAIDDRLKTLKQQVAEASADESAALGLLDQATVRRRDLDKKVVSLDAQLAAAQSEFDAAVARLNENEVSVVDAETRYQQVVGDLSAARSELRSRAVDAFIREPSTQAAGVLLQLKTLHQLIASYSFLTSSVKAQGTAVDRVAAVRDDLGVLREIMTAARDSSAVERADVARRRDKLATTRVALATARNDARTEEAHQSDLVAALQTHVKQYEAEIAQLKRESDAIAALLRGRQAGQRIIPAGKGVLASPIPGAAITSGFGPRLHPILGTVRMHTGVDFEASQGTPIRASADGTVVTAADCGGYGNCTILDHGNALATLYAHQSSIAVKEGQTVRRGQVIGAVGSTGLSTGPHLHFEVRVAGTPVDPLPYL